jgi:hypothetical protein
MTVAELRKSLDGVPDDQQVVIVDTDWDCDYMFNHVLRHKAKVSGQAALVTDSSGYSYGIEHEHSLDQGAIRQDVFFIGTVEALFEGGPDAEDEPYEYEDDYEADVALRNAYPDGILP